MKLIHKQHSIFLPNNTARLLEEATEIWIQWRRQKLPLYLFLGISINLFIAPLVYAATDGGLYRPQSWALGLLGLGVIAISIYLFFVMFVPERF
ncbi:potassium-transporting ATPase subunit F [Planktothrix sp. FACHB-1355]|uniref:Potassium-transporting ATPase subunit F n=1 Tax=Aerosakkonema funiforme FACHB-1375 TaxID=2949571 RepID=A0A926VG85_9CYAN|nr:MULTISPECIES: potassium-transporting ATPase subunit F [Oscillatoriales]MBD2183197.1 potassium-transporting ATPase subunit F [Aerosakkonema funiforme FACHB-1375]MBD3557437.1 potassium-transporting ATPase subunit F [Planktothrix sp. FACHB-1355]